MEMRGYDEIRRTGTADSGKLEALASTTYIDVFLWLQYSGLHCGVV
jgi:hypothetical protein